MFPRFCPASSPPTHPKKIEQIKIRNNLFIEKHLNQFIKNVYYSATIISDNFYVIINYKYSLFDVSIMNA
jgi:hypothetical protein